MKDVIKKEEPDGSILYTCPYCGKRSHFGGIIQSHMHTCEKLYYAKREARMIEEHYKRLNSFERVYIDDCSPYWVEHDDDD